MVGAGARAPLHRHLLCTYRGHGAVLAKGASLERCFAEIIGKANGCLWGKGGSMHLTDVSVGALGSFAIIGAHLPIAAGVAFAARYRGQTMYASATSATGAPTSGHFTSAEPGSAVETARDLCLREQPLRRYSPIATTTPGAASRPGTAYGMASEAIDGNDLFVVYEAIERAAARARAGHGPTFIEALTYRHKGHSRTDPGEVPPRGRARTMAGAGPDQAAGGCASRSGRRRRTARRHSH